MGATSGAEKNANPSTPVYSGFFGYSILVICVVFCRSSYRSSKSNGDNKQF
jgi:hypothetical protein